MQIQKNQVISKGWKLIWCMADPTVCRYKETESSTRDGNLFGVWQTLLYADTDKSSHQQGMETHMVYGRHYCMQIQRNESSTRDGNLFGVWQTLLYADTDKSSHQQGMETRLVYGRPYCMQIQRNRVINKGWKLIWCMADTTVCRYKQIRSSTRDGNSFGVWQTLLYADTKKQSHQQGMETRLVYGRPYCMQMQTNRVISKCWKLIWCMEEPTVCRCRQIESSASAGNSYGVRQILLYADANVSCHQQVLESHMVYGRTYCMQMQTNRVISKCWKLIWCMVEPTLSRCRQNKSSARVGNSYGVWQNLLYADADTASHQQGLKTRTVYGRTYCMQKQTQRVIGKNWKLILSMVDLRLW